MAGYYFQSANSLLSSLDNLNNIFSCEIFPHSLTLRVCHPLTRQQRQTLPSQYLKRSFFNFRNVNTNFFGWSAEKTNTGLMIPICYFRNNVSKFVFKRHSLLPLLANQIYEFPSFGNTSLPPQFLYEKAVPTSLLQNNSHLIKLYSFCLDCCIFLRN